MPQISFSWIDVFAEEALSGNPLALVPDADELSEVRMKAIAKEFNQSETTFLVAPSDARADYRLRSYTAAGVEVFGAGHNAMGAWIWLALAGRIDPGRSHYAQQIGDEVLAVALHRSDEGIVTVTMRQSAPRLLAEADDVPGLERALGLAPGSVRRDIPTRVASTGAEHLLVPIRSSEAVDEARPSVAELERLLAGLGAEGCYLYALPDEGGLPDAYTRFFNPTVGIAEDPATGTAAGPLAAFLVQGGYLAHDRPLVIEQGSALGRRSLLTVRVDGDIVELSGSGVIAADGVLHL